MPTCHSTRASALPWRTSIAINRSQVSIIFGQITSADYVRLAEGKITQRTAQNDLSKLEKMGLLRQVGSKRAAYYVLVSDNFRKLFGLNANF